MIYVRGKLYLRNAVILLRSNTALANNFRARVIIQSTCINDILNVKLHSLYALTPEVA